MTVAAPRFGFLGGTFDPVHNAHLDLAELLSRRLSLDRLSFLPAGTPWQKNDVATSPEHRLAMLRLAIAQRGLGASIDERELRRAGPSFTVDSLIEMRAEIGENSVLVLLMGADQLLRLHTWSRWRELFRFANLAVGGRPSFEFGPGSLEPSVDAEVRQRQVIASALPGSLSAAAGQIVLVPADLGATSSSTVRLLLAAHDFDAVRDLLPSSVLDYIRANHLYTH